MPTEVQKLSTASKEVWTGRVMSGLAIAFLLLDGVMKLAQPAPVLQANAQLGYPASGIITLGVLLLLCTLVYMIPRTSVLGAILLTGYLGGAVAAQLRVGNPLFSHVLFPVYLAGLLWGGLYLREARLRALVPVKVERVRDVLQYGNSASAQ